MYSGARTGGAGGSCPSALLLGRAKGAELPEQTDDTQKNTGATRNILVITVLCFVNQNSLFKNTT